MTEQDGSPHESATSSSELDPKIEKRIVRKLDLTLIPLLWFLFVVAFMDRSNMGEPLYLRPFRTTDTGSR